MGSGTGSGFFFESGDSAVRVGCDGPVGSRVWDVDEAYCCRGSVFGMGFHDVFESEVADNVSIDDHERFVIEQVFCQSDWSSGSELVFLDWEDDVRAEPALA